MSKAPDRQGLSDGRTSIRRYLNNEAHLGRLASNNEHDPLQTDLEQ
jgi:hypothetical protein